VETVRRYVDANREGQQWLLRYCTDHEVPFQTRPAFTYATTAEGQQSAQNELKACVEAGLPAGWVTDTELPFPVQGAVHLADQAQFNPMHLLTAMAHDLRTPTSELVTDLTSWTEQHWPGADRTHVWSAQDYHSVHELPYAGPLTPFNDRVLVATGYDKWGMTKRSPPPWSCPATSSVGTRNGRRSCEPGPRKRSPSRCPRRNSISRWLIS
jgi:glycine/D-amino acid oxidase-like deaminating enzyme